MARASRWRLISVNGKTALVLGLANDALGTGAFSGGIVWLQANPGPVAALASLAPTLRAHTHEPVNQLPGESNNARSTAGLVRVALRRSELPLLLVLDNLGDVEWTNWLPGGENVHVVGASRDRRCALGEAFGLATFAT